MSADPHMPMHQAHGECCYAFGELLGQLGIVGFYRDVFEAEFNRYATWANRFLERHPRHRKSTGIQALTTKVRAATPKIERAPQGLLATITTSIPWNLPNSGLSDAEQQLSRSLAAIRAANTSLENMGQSVNVAETLSGGIKKFRKLNVLLYGVEKELVPRLEFVLEKMVCEVNTKEEGKTVVTLDPYDVVFYSTYVKELENHLWSAIRVSQKDPSCVAVAITDKERTEKLEREVFNETGSYIFKASELDDTHLQQAVENICKKECKWKPKPKPEPAR